MQKRTKKYQLDIFGNEISLNELKNIEKVSKKWNRKKESRLYFQISHLKKVSGLYGTSTTKYE